MKIKFVLAYATFLLISIIFMYIIMSWNDVWNKAQQYDIYKSYIDQFKQCLPYHPVVICKSPEEVGSEPATNITLPNISIPIR